MTTLTAGKFSGASRSPVQILTQTWREKARARREKHAAIAALKTLNAAVLRDIGIDRSEITSVIHSQPQGRRKTHDRF
ncbi:MAG: DUF1127 domain-containing protein [Alphaproteobacteria bacterium]|nr:DUF1127 domain-containing protein [Alphaproteobacteria bacterium]